MNAPAKKIELQLPHKRSSAPLDSAKLIGVAPAPELSSTAGDRLKVEGVSDASAIKTSGEAEELSGAVGDEIRARFLGRDGSGIPTYGVRD